MRFPNLLHVRVSPYTLVNFVILPRLVFQESHWEGICAFDLIEIDAFRPHCLPNPGSNSGPSDPSPVGVPELIMLMNFYV